MTQPKMTTAADELMAVKRRVDEAERQINLLIDRHAHPETIAEAIDWMITLQRQRQRIVWHRCTGATAQGASAGSAGLESAGFARAGRACAEAQRRDCKKGASA